VTLAALRQELARLGFEEKTLGRSGIYLAGPIAHEAESIFRHLSSRAGCGKGAGNRRSAVPLHVAGLPSMYARRSRRGGLMRFVVSELYAGAVPRPLHELMITAAARQRGLPVVEPMGAVVEKAGPWLYRGWFLTRALEGTTLWNFLLAETDPDQRRAALVSARDSIDRLHEAGLYHSDLNLHNLFICTGQQPPRAIAIDLDKARLYSWPLAASRRAANFRRLGRSAVRLSAAGGMLADSEQKLIGIA
jgi:3-deoxy-D-manno-octulosonic-acid transferase